MASEDSRNRDGFRKFIDSATAAISASPATVRCRRSRIMRTTVENLSNSRAFAVLSGFRSKNGMTCPVRSSRDRTDHHTVDEPDDPLLESWPFLLIDRTGHIVTSTADPRNWVRQFR